MSILTSVGWTVIHSLWASTLFAGVAAMVLSLLGDRRAAVRHAIGYVTLVLMLAAPCAMAIARPDPMSRATRRYVSSALDAVVGLPAVVRARGAVVPIAGALWLAGIVIAFARIAPEWRRVRALRRLDVTTPAGAAHPLVGTLSKTLSVGFRIEVRRSPRASVPIVVGWRRPVILLPDATEGALDPAQLRAILAHEIAHVRRRDYAANIAQMAVETLLFHHPGARWISRRIRIEREVPLR